MDPVSIGLGVAGIAGNLFTNQTNQRNFDKQLAFQKYQYEDQKRYNSALEQANRLRAAGLNPALVFGGDAGTASAVSEPAAPVQNPLDLSGLAQIGQGVTLNDALKEKTNAETQNTDVDTTLKQKQGVAQDIDNLWKDENFRSMIYNRDMDSWFKEHLVQQAKLGIQFDTQSMKDRLWQAKMESQYTQAKAYAQFYVNQYIPLKQQAEIDELVARASMNVRLGIASVKQAQASIMQAESTKNAFDAQYGGDPKQRGNFFNATLRLLNQQFDESKSREYDNVTTRNPLPPNSLQYKHYHSWKTNSSSW